MKQKYEYKFVRIGEGFFGVKSQAASEYQGVILEHAREGWRLVQIFAPGTGVSGMAGFFEMIFEREVGG